MFKVDEKTSSGGDVHMQGVKLTQRKTCDSESNVVPPRAFTRASVGSLNIFRHYRIARAFRGCISRCFSDAPYKGL